MGCWGLLGLFLIVVVDHSRKFPTFSTSKTMFMILDDSSGLVDSNW